jgi:uncharacterized protein YegJ (DUF2314 family)
MNKLFWIAVIFVFISCKGKDKNGKVENDGDTVVSVDADDKDMNTAITKAKATYDGFLKALKSNEKDTRDYYVKMEFEGEKGGEVEVEHMWVGDLFYKKDNLFGTLMSQPVYVLKHTAGDTIKVDEKLVSDWSYIKNDKLVGGYTILVLYHQMNKKEQEEFKKQLDYQIE